MVFYDSDIHSDIQLPTGKSSHCIAQFQPRRNKYFDTYQHVIKY